MPNITFDSHRYSYTALLAIISIFVTACTATHVTTVHKLESYDADDWPIVPGLNRRVEIPLAHIFTYPLNKDSYSVCLSGGGYRATLFHLGVLWRLNDEGLLEQTGRLVGVSGGSILAAYVGTRWKDLTFVNGTATNFKGVVVEPILQLTSHTIDIPSHRTPEKDVNRDSIPFWVASVPAHLP